MTLTFTDYLNSNDKKPKGRKDPRAKNRQPNKDYGPRANPGPSSDASNLAQGLAMGFGGENEEEDFRTDRLVPGDSKPRDRSYETNKKVTPVSNNHADHRNDDDDTEELGDFPNADGDDLQGDNEKQGLIRVVPNAHLVYKKQSEDGSYEELWAFNVGRNFKDNDTRKQILSSTDIPPDKVESDDGTQRYEIWTRGNIQLMNIKGLPN